MEHARGDDLRAEIALLFLELTRDLLRLASLPLEQDQKTRNRVGREPLLLAEQERDTVGDRDAHIPLDRHRGPYQDKTRVQLGAQALPLADQPPALHRLDDCCRGQLVEQWKIVDDEKAAIGSSDEPGAERSRAGEECSVEIDPSDQPILCYPDRHLDDRHRRIDMIVDELPERAEQRRLAAADRTGKNHPAQRRINQRAEQRSTRDVEAGVGCEREKHVRELLVAGRHRCERYVGNRTWKRETKRAGER